MAVKDSGNGRAPRRLRNLSMLFIAVGAVLLLVALFRGGTMLIAFVKGGLPLRTIRDVNFNFGNILFDFFVPLVGGIMLIFAGSVIMKFHESTITSHVMERNRRVVKDKREVMISKSLGADERKVLDLLGKKKGGTLQSEIVIMTGFSKVKVHRILKKLENLDLIKRGRFGITNKVYLSFTG
jgi:uncharacterized membrane protein